MDIRARVAAARHLGISLREFEGWVPERTTTYEHGRDGRLVRSSEYVESAWDEHQQALMLAYAEWEESRCPVCGGDPRECQDRDADPDNPFATWIYRPKLPKVISQSVIEGR